VLHATVGALHDEPARGFTLAVPPQVLPPPGSSARSRLDWCGEQVAMIHDVHWASACELLARERQARHAACLREKPAAGCEAELEPPDDSPDCTLPDRRALALNQARARAEQQCIDEAAASANALFAGKP
jgi:hypothetical protein